MILLSGSKLGPYEILAPIGAGGMGEVYRASDSRIAGGLWFLPSGRKIFCYDHRPYQLAE